MLRLGVLVLAIGCGSVKNNEQADAPVTPDDGDVDSPAARCDTTQPFGAPTLVPNVNSSNDEFSFGIVRDESIAFVGHVIQPPNISVTILESQRVGGTFGAPTANSTAAINNVAGNETAAVPTSDGQLMYFHRQDANTIGIFVSTQAAGGTYTAGDPVVVDGGVLQNALSATISADGQTLYWLDFADFGAVFAATRAGTPSNFTNRRPAATVFISSQPILTADELTMFYAVGNGDDVLISTRATTNDRFGVGVPVANVNLPNVEDQPVALSHDECVLYISSGRPGGVGGRDIWEARRPL